MDDFASSSRSPQLAGADDRLAPRGAPELPLDRSSPWRRACMGLDQEKQPQLMTTQTCNFRDQGRYQLRKHVGPSAWGELRSAGVAQRPEGRGHSGRGSRDAYARRGPDSGGCKRVDSPDLDHHGRPRHPPVGRPDRRILRSGRGPAPVAERDPFSSRRDAGSPTMSGCRRRVTVRVLHADAPVLCAFWPNGALSSRI